MKKKYPIYKQKLTLTVFTLMSFITLFGQNSITTTSVIENERTDYTFTIVTDSAGEAWNFIDIFPVANWATYLPFANNSMPSDVLGIDIFFNDSNTEEVGFLRDFNDSIRFDYENPIPIGTKITVILRAIQNPSAGTNLEAKIIVDTYDNPITTYSNFFDIIANPNGNSQTSEVVAGTGNPGYSGDGALSINAELNTPRHLVFDSMGNMYFADQQNHAIRKIDSNGIISTIAGSGTQGYSGDGDYASSAQLNNPRGINIDNNDNIIIADSGNGAIRRIDSDGIITTIAVGFGIPIGICTDNLNNIYVADFSSHKVRKIDTNGAISTIAGNGNDYSHGDGDLAVNAGLNSPYNVVLKNGTIWIVDFAGSIRKINSSGIISTVTDLISSPTALSFDDNNNLYISALSGGIYKIDAKENITIAFEPRWAFGGIAFDKDFNLYCSHISENQIKKINISSLSTANISAVNKVKIFPNPTQKDITLDISSLFEIENIYLYDSNGKLLERIWGENLTFFKNKNTIKIPLKNSGIYFVKIKSKQGIITKKIIRI